MDEGKDLLYKIIDNKLIRLSRIDSSAYLYNNVNLVELSSSIKEDINNIANLTNEVINKVVTFNDCLDIEKDIIQVRDLYLGKKDYNINIEDTEKNKIVSESFVNLLDKLIYSNSPEILTANQTKIKCEVLYNKIKNKEIIDEFDYIETIVKEYEPVKFNKNMITVMNYITKHNLTILNTNTIVEKEVSTNMVRRIQIDEKIKDILSKLKIEFSEVPNFLLGEIKSCNVDEFIKTYNLVKKKSAEDYGILHLIKKDNKVARLSLLLFSNTESIKNVVDSVRNEEKIDMDLLKIITNNMLSAFFIKNNQYFKPKYNEYIKNMNMLKELGVNYKSLIKRCPLFVISNHEVIDYTLDYAVKHGADKKTLINKCYKTLTIDPGLIIENIETLKKYNIVLENYFSEAKDKYNLLKTVNLGLKIRFIINNYNLDSKEIDYKLINSIIVNKVYKESQNNMIVWGE